MDELEEELKSLLEESQTDIGSGLPEVPSKPLRPFAEHSLMGNDLLSSLPAVPKSSMNITTEQLEQELNQLTLTDTGLFTASSFIYVYLDVIVSNN